MEVKYLDKNGKALKSLTQWDVNRKLEIDGLELTKPPMVHFYNEYSIKSLVVPSEIVDKKIITDIPNILLQKNKNIKIAVFVDDGEEGKTIYLDEIPVTQKLEPEDYNYVENIEYANWVELSEEAKRQLLEMQEIINDVNSKLENGDFIGETGNGISKIEKTKTEGLVDTYTIYYTNGGTYTYQIKNGSGEGTGTTDYTKLSNLPSINGVILSGNKTTEDLKIKAIAEVYSAQSEEPENKDILWIDTDDNSIGDINIDTEMSDTSTNLVQNKVIKQYVDSQIQSSITNVLGGSY